MSNIANIEFPEFSAAVLKLSGAIDSIEDIHLFLATRDVTKSNSTRFFVG
jgi:hypothetical protein